MIGTIFDIKEMAVHDGPGIRTTAFFKGCPLRCRWCHNPEGLIDKPQLMYKKSRCIKCKMCTVPCKHEDCKPFGRCIHVCPENALEVVGRELSAGELAKELRSSADVLGDSFGGFTFSGGEPLAQAEFLFETADILKDYHLCIETSAYADKQIFDKMLSLMDYIIMDIKIADDVTHKKYTGVRNKKILDNFERLRLSGKPYCVRTPLIPGVTDINNNLAQIKQIIGDSKWEKIPYNSAAGAKYDMLGMTYPLNCGTN